MRDAYVLALYFEHFTSKPFTILVRDDAILRFQQGGHELYSMQSSGNAVVTIRSHISTINTVPSTGLYSDKNSDVPSDDRWTPRISRMLITNRRFRITNCARHNEQTEICITVFRRLQGRDLLSQESCRRSWRACWLMICPYKSAGALELQLYTCTCQHSATGCRGFARNLFTRDLATWIGGRRREERAGDH